MRDKILEIVEYRFKRGWTVEELAARAGVCKKTILDLESSGRLPRADVLNKVAEALNDKSFIQTVLRNCGRLKNHATQG